MKSTISRVRITKKLQPTTAEYKYMYEQALVRIRGLEASEQKYINMLDQHDLNSMNLSTVTPAEELQQLRASVRRQAEEINRLNKRSYTTTMTEAIQDSVQVTETDRGHYRDYEVSFSSTGTCHKRVEVEDTMTVHRFSDPASF